MVELGKLDPRIIGVTAAMLDGTGLNDFAKAFPKRFYDVGIAEEHAVGLSAGLAFLEVCINTKALIPTSDMPICPRRRTKNNILLMVSPLKKEREGGSIKIGISLSNWAVF